MEPDTTETTTRYCASKTHEPVPPVIRLKSPDYVLKKTPASSRIPEKPIPQCSFTVHIGSIVLSDEAVEATKHLELFLQWKFYDQNFTITAMRPGRVVHFDFSTEYFIKVTNHFLHFLKEAQMFLVISEMGSESEPYAHCMLPLRDVLVKPNRRVDFSLALMAGPPLDTEEPYEDEDEIGVLDLWCILRYDGHVAPLFEAALASDETIHKLKRITPSIRSGKANTIPIMEEIAEESGHSDLETTTKHIDSRRDRKNVILHEAKPSSKELYKSPDHTIQCRTVNTQTSTESMKSSHPDNATDAGSSDLIVYQVPTNVKTAKEMRRILEIKNKRSSPTQNDVLKKNSSNSENVMSLSSFEKKGRGMVDKLNNEHFNRTCSTIGSKRTSDVKKSVKIDQQFLPTNLEKDKAVHTEPSMESVCITIMWLAFNEESEAMLNPEVTQLYVAYTFLGRSGMELETPVSMSKPGHFVEKIYFNFRKTFKLQEAEQRMLAHMARCTSSQGRSPNSHDCIIFTVVSEPAEDPLGLNNCEDIGHACLYLGDLLTYCAGDSYTEVIPVTAAGQSDEAGGVCGVLAVRVDGLDAVRTCAERDGFTVPNMLDNFR